ncbi:hypothetical protein SAMN05428969_2361 [Devosia sp. YR412]|nr:hypothetical protein [Devosia sp. YR412]SEQ24169.1 hypothetical protein SAMN05428969_2361 [Devosia sp. YR412]
MTELDLLMAVAISIAGCLLAAGGALWIARKDNTRPHPPAGE